MNAPADPIPAAHQLDKESTMANRPRKYRPHGEFLTVPFAGRIPTEADKRAWLETAYREFLRVLRAKYKAMEADDIAANEVAQATEKIDELILTWTVKRYVRQRANGDRALLDWKRSERVQRCEGARGTRTTVSIDTPLNDADAARGRMKSGTTVAEVIAAKQTAVDEGVDSGLIERLLEVLDDRARHIVLRVAVDGATVIDVAAELRLARETVSRLYNRALRTIRSERGVAIATYLGDDEVQPPC